MEASGRVQRGPQRGDRGGRIRPARGRPRVPDGVVAGGQEVLERPRGSQGAQVQPGAIDGGDAQAVHVRDELGRQRPAVVHQTSPPDASRPPGHGEVHRRVGLELARRRVAPPPGSRGHRQTVQVGRGLVGEDGIRAPAQKRGEVIGEKPCPGSVRPRSAQPVPGRARCRWMPCPTRSRSDRRARSGGSPSRARSVADRTAGWSGGRGVTTRGMHPSDDAGGAPGARWPRHGDDARGGRCCAGADGPRRVPPSSSSRPRTAGEFRGRYWALSRRDTTGNRPPTRRGTRREGARAAGRPRRVSSRAAPRSVRRSGRRGGGPRPRQWWSCGGTAGSARRRGPRPSRCAPPRRPAARSRACPR